MDPRLKQIAAYFLARSHAAEFSPQSISPNLLPFLFVLEIERSAAAGVSALRVRLVGTALDRAFGRPLAGLALDSFIHGPRSDGVLQAFHHCATTQDPIWMRQVVHMRERLARFVEGVAVYLEPERLYGGVVVGRMPSRFAANSFEHKVLTREILQQS
jgi:hypothetical protein